jgi:hypothetical protein
MKTMDRDGAVNVTLVDLENELATLAAEVEAAEINYIRLKAESQKSNFDANSGRHLFSLSPSAQVSQSRFYRLKRLLNDAEQRYIHFR